MTKTCEHCAERDHENAGLRSQIQRLESQLVALDSHYVLKLDLPSGDQARALWRKVTARWPRMISPSDSEKDQVAGMIGAMGYCFTCRKTATRTTDYDSTWWTARAMEFVNSAHMHVPRIRSLLLGIIAVNDVPYILNNNELYLNPFGRGQQIDRTAWRRLLADGGEPVREPTPGKPPFSDGSIGPVNVSGVW
jgi:hypothetical protein